jgi:tetratricopeptide (TPR) repeat protein
VLSEARAEGDELTLAIALNNVGNVVLDDRDLVSARRYIEECVELNRRLGQQRRVANDLVDLGFIALADDRRDAAATALREALALNHDERIPEGVLWSVEGLAAFSLHQGNASRAVRLLAATTRSRAEIGFSPAYFPIGEEMRQQTLGVAREQLGEAAFAEAWEQGEKMSLDEAAQAASGI